MQLTARILGIDHPKYADLMIDLAWVFMVQVLTLIFSLRVLS